MVSPGSKEGSTMSDMSNVYKRFGPRFSLHWDCSWCCGF